MAEPIAIIKKSSRILTFDLMRGYFMLSIILNHLYWYPNGLDWVSARGDMFVTAAEGFFLISGIVLGIVRGRKLINKPFRVPAKLLLKRSLQLYVTSVVLMLIFTLLGWWFFMDNPGLKPGIRPLDQPLWQVLGGALSFQYLYGWADYLRLYSIFLLVSPLALWLLRRGRWYVVLAVSLLIYSLYPLALSAGAGNSDITPELLMPIAWQLIFFTGFTIGFQWDNITAWWRALSIKIKRPVVVTILSLAGLTLLANLIVVFDLNVLGLTAAATSGDRAELLPLFVKESLPLPRLMLFGLWFGAAFWLFRRYEATINKYFGWLILSFGVNSLYVYTIHAFVIFLAHMIMVGTDNGLVIDLVGSFIVVGLIWLAVRYRVLMNIIPR